jgi:hypothetical protein
MEDSDRDLLATLSLNRLQGIRKLYARLQITSLQA